MDINCPHCQRAIHLDLSEQHDLDIDLTEQLGQQTNGRTFWKVVGGNCSSCKKEIIYLTVYERTIVAGITSHYKTLLSKLVFPFGVARFVSPNVSKTLRKKYQEAAATLVTSTAASAALSRKILEAVLDEQLDATGNDLRQKIKSVKTDVPSYLYDVLDHVRIIGKWAAHPLKSSDPGQIVEVEDGEAEWCLQVLDALFDFCFDLPAKTKAMQNSISQKIQQSKK